MTLIPLNAAQQDRAAGVLLATAAGDALGAGYEFGPPLSVQAPVGMVGGGGFGWEPGEWTDDTSMAIVIADVAASGADLVTDTAQDQIAARWCEWATSAKDVGSQTRAVLSATGRAARSAGGASVRAGEMHVKSKAHHDRHGRSGGNGSLMRTAPLAVAYLDDEDGLVQSASALSALTHFDPEAGEACVLWTLAIRHAVLTGELDARYGLHRLDPLRREIWSARLADAESLQPAEFDRNGWVVQALQAAWSAISTTPVPADDPQLGTFRAQHLRLALEAAVRGGRDTDTVAAIAGGLLGGTYGASAVPAAWRRMLHGWPGLRTRDLVALAMSILRGGTPDSFDYTYCAYQDLDVVTRHPYDERLWLGGIGVLRRLPAEVDAVVSLCRVGPEQPPRGIELVDVRLIDRNGADQNPNLGYVLDDTVSLIEQLRREGRTVLLHCVQAHSRTPAVAALYGARLRGVTADEALADVQSVLADSHPIRDFRDALKKAARQ